MVAKAKQCAMCREKEATMCLLMTKAQICETCYYAVSVGMAFTRILRFVFMK